MLKSLTIQNFQAHKRLEVRFDPRITTIIGPSDVGKSAVIRALTWLATNKPAGTAFIREGSKATNVELFVDGKTILRHRSASVNTYELDGQELKAFGNDVPPEVLKLLNLSSVNFQGQHDSPFWFSETAGEVSRQLNQIVDLGVIDSTLAYLDKELRAGRDRVRVGEERLKEAKARRSSLKSVREMDAGLVRIESLAEEAASLGQGLARTRDQVRGFRILSDGSERLALANGAVAGALKSGRDWENSRNRTETARELVRKARELEEIAGRQVPDVDPLIRLKEVSREARKRRELADELTERARTLSLTVSRKVPDVDPLLTLLRSWEKLNQQKLRLDDIKQALVMGKAEAEDRKRSAHKVMDAFESQMGEVCPLCGAKR